jgi:ribonuclease BN (tRNA processing enzyme)
MRVDGPMELLVLGSSASTPAAGDACSGYLVRQGETEVLLDCGSGVLSRLQEFTAVERLAAIVISHFHPDHYLDLIPMRYGLRYGLTTPVRPLVLVPPGGTAFLERLGSALREAPHFFNASFEIMEIDPVASVRVGAFTLTFQQTTHDEPTWACAVQGTRRLVYSADTQSSPELERFAAGADLLLCEATYPASVTELPSGNHLTALEAGQLARAAGVRSVMLTHFWPGLSRAHFAAEAASAFGAPVLLAEPGRRVELTGDALGNDAISHDLPPGSIQG